MLYALIEIGMFILQEISIFSSIKYYFSLCWTNIIFFFFAVMFFILFPGRVGESQ